MSAGEISPPSAAAATIVPSVPGLHGEAHGPLLVVPGAVTVHTGNITGAVT